MGTASSPSERALGRSLVVVVVVDVVRARRSERERSRERSRRRRDRRRVVVVGGGGVERVERVGAREELADVGAFGVRWKLRGSREAVRRQSSCEHGTRVVEGWWGRRCGAARTSGMASTSSSSARWAASSRVPASRACVDVVICVVVDARASVSVSFLHARDAHLGPARDGTARTSSRARCTRNDQSNRVAVPRARLVSSSLSRAVDAP